VVFVAPERLRFLGIHTIDASIRLLRHPRLRGADVTPSQLQTIFEHATVPEHSVAFMKDMSGGESPLWLAPISLLESIPLSRIEHFFKNCGVFSRLIGFFHE